MGAPKVGRKVALTADQAEKLRFEFARLKRLGYLYDPAISRAASKVGCSIGTAKDVLARRGVYAETPVSNAAAS